MKDSAKIIAKNIIIYLKQTGKFSLLPEITKILEEAVFDAANDSKAIVTSSYRLSDRQLLQIKKALNLIFDKELTILNKIDPSLIAGLRITVQDKVVDLSVSKTLDNLKNEINHD